MINLKKYNIPERELRRLYAKGLKFNDICKHFNCSLSVIWNRFREFDIKPNRCKKELKISKETLEKLYWKKKYSSRKIERIFGYNKNSILKLMKKYGIRARTKSETSKMIVHPIKYKIPEKRLRRLYIDKKLSTYQIASILKCPPMVIFERLRKYNIPRRDVFDAINLTIERRSRKIAKSVTRHQKNSFLGSLAKKAYLIGFRLGDLHVRKNRYGQTIMVQTWTTKQEQVDLMEKLFKDYGYVYLSRKKNGQIQFCCNLDMTFDFLLNKKDGIEKWIFDNNKYFASFLAGYIDAEGHFGVHNGFAEFSLSSCDKNILNQIYSKLLKMNIRCNSPRIKVKKGYVDKRGVKWNKDLWRVKITRKDDLYKLICLLENFIKHEKRFNNMIKAKNNIIERNKKFELGDLRYRIR